MKPEGACQGIYWGQRGLRRRQAGEGRGTYLIPPLILDVSLVMITRSARCFQLAGQAFLFDLDGLLWYD
jgi:hypothetical protein